MRNILISIEGIEGVGKTTIAKLLVDRLNMLKIKTVYTFEPTDSLYGKLARKLIEEGGEIWKWERALLIALDRAHHVQKFIIPKIQEGYIVVCDRYIHSQLAYQGAEGLNHKVLEELNKDFPKPDITFYLDSEPKYALRRLREYIKRKNLEKKKRSIFNDESFLDRVRALYFHYLDDKRFTPDYVIIDIDENVGVGYLPDNVYFERINRIVESMVRYICETIKYPFYTSSIIV